MKVLTDWLSVNAEPDTLVNEEAMGTSSLTINKIIKHKSLKWSNYGLMPINDWKGK